MVITTSTGHFMPFGAKNSRGEPTNAIYGFIKAIRKMLVDLKPDRAAVIWDCGLPARRVELQPAYKQNRTAMPDDLRPQEEWLQKHPVSWDSQRGTPGYRSRRPYCDLRCRRPPRWRGGGDRHKR